MRSGKILLVVLLAGLTGHAADAEEIQWLQSIEQAKQIAAASQRLVLIHFWSTTCKPCSQLEKEVYNYPGIGPQIGASFVPVKINADEHPAVRQQFNIEFVPTDVVLAPDGSVVAHRSCPLNRFEYIAGLAQVAASYTTKTAGPYANVAASGTGTAAATVQAGASQVTAAANQLAANQLAANQLTANQLTGAAANQTTGTAAHLGDRYQHLMDSPANISAAANNVSAAANNVVAPTGGIPTAGTPYSPPAASLTAAAAGPTAAASQTLAVAQKPYVPPAMSTAPPAFHVAAAPKGQATAQQASAILPTQPAAAAAKGLQPPSSASPTPPLGLEGTCPVELVDNERWVTGDRRWGAIHRGKLYLFSSQAHQQKFLSNPDYYSPAISGNDPVLAVDQRQFVAGKRRHGLFYDKRVFLFASEETLARFYQDPLRYAEGIRNVSLAGGR